MTTTERRRSAQKALDGPSEMVIPDEIYKTTTAAVPSKHGKTAHVTGCCICGCQRPVRTVVAAKSSHVRHLEVKNT
jgi:hypothetical protein